MMVEQEQDGEIGTRWRDRNKIEELKHDTGIGNRKETEKQEKMEEKEHDGGIGTRCRNGNNME